MIYRNGRLVLFINLTKDKLTTSIDAVYKGSLLVWLTVIDAIKSCYGSGTWLRDKNWINDDYWKTK